MRSPIKFISSLLATLALIVTASVNPAAANPSPSVSLTVSQTNTLDGSALTDFDPSSQLYLTLILSDGLFSWNQGDSASGAMQTAYVSHSQTPVLQLLGTMDQLNAALPEIKVINPCVAGDVQVYAQVSTTSYIQDPTTGHFFNNLTSTDTFDNQVANADGWLLGDSSATRGYLATIGSTLENKIATYLSTAPAFIGASDLASEGDWTWTQGPEAGSMFYQGQGDFGGGAVNESSTFWAKHEPNNWNGAENFAVISDMGDWSDVEDSYYGAVVEWGGMAGDVVDQSSVGVVATNYTFSASSSFAGGDGTENTPWLVSNQSQFEAIGRCGLVGAYYVQTSDIELNNWQPIGDYDHPFLGHFNGDGWTTTLVNTTFNHSYSGIFARIGDNDHSVTDVSVQDMVIQGDVAVDGFVSQIGLLAGQADKTSIKWITVSGSLNGQGFDYSGGLVGYVNYTDLLSINSSVTISQSNGSLIDYIGGVAGRIESDGNNTAQSVRYNGTIQMQGGGRNIGCVFGESVQMTLTEDSANCTMQSDAWMFRVGGLLGRGSSNQISSSFANVNINVPIGGNMGGLIGDSNDNAIYKSYSTGDIVGAGTIGGLVGSAGSTRFENTYSSVAVTGQIEVGAFGGYLAGGVLMNSYARGLVTMTDPNATSNGWYGTSDSQEISNFYWVPAEVGISADNVTALAGATPMTHDQGITLEQYTNWDISIASDGLHTWVLCPDMNNGYPYLFDTNRGAVCQRFLTDHTAPTVAGTGNVGSALTIVTGAWDTGVTFTYQWKADGQPIAGATAATYTPVAGDVGKNISVDLTGAKPGYQSETMTSTNAILVKAVSQTTGGATNPVVTPTNGAYVMSGDTGFSWNRSKGWLGFKVLSVYTGPIKGTLTFKSGGKNYTCTVSFGILKKQAKSKSLTFKSPNFCFGAKEKTQLAALKKIAKNTVVKIVTMRENHAPTTYKKLKVINRTIYIKLG